MTGTWDRVAPNPQYYYSQKHQKKVGRIPEIVHKFLIIFSTLPPQLFYLEQSKETWSHENCNLFNKKVDLKVIIRLSPKE